MLFVDDCTPFHRCGSAAGKLKLLNKFAPKAGLGSPFRCFNEPESMEHFVHINPHWPARNRFFKLKISRLISLPPVSCNQQRGRALIHPCLAVQVPLSAPFSFLSDLRHITNLLAHPFSLTSHH